jgi:NDP-sugar pyrophosphorylase family protein
MKAVILAGSLGTRLSEETLSKPKPMVEFNLLVNPDLIKVLIEMNLA